MKILVTGSNGFVGKNLITTLNSQGYEVLTFDKQNQIEDLVDLTKSCDFVVHLAGVNRPENVDEFYEGNKDLSIALTSALRLNGNKAPILVSSSIQAELDNDYGKSKLAGENVLREHAINNDSKIYVYRFSNLFGKWSQPNYNTVIATWCYNISREIPLIVNDRSVELNLMYIDDVVQEMLNAIKGNPCHVSSDLYTVSENYDVTLGTIYDLLHKFKESRITNFIPNMSKGFESKLYSTYLSFLPKDSFSYPLKMNVDQRGSFTEFIKSNDRGQVSINISKPGITKGQHWHHSKNEKFLVVSGKGFIQFRDIFCEEIIEYHVDGDDLQVVDIPTGYTHNIINTGSTDMVTVMWVNEPFDPNKPDTFFEEV